MRHGRNISRLTDAVQPVVTWASKFAETGAPEDGAQLFAAFRDAQPTCRQVIADLDGAVSFGGTYGAAEARLLEGTRMVLNAAMVGQSSFTVVGDRLRGVDEDVAMQAARAAHAAWEAALS